MKQDFSSHVNVQNTYTTVVQEAKDDPEARTLDLLTRARQAIVATHAGEGVKLAREALRTTPSSAMASLLLSVAALSKGPIRRLTREEARNITSVLKPCLRDPATEQCALYIWAALCHGYYAKNGYSQPDPDFEQCKKLFYAKWPYLSDEWEDLVGQLSVEDDFEVAWFG